MRANGPPEPQFVTDEGRTFFAVELPIHQTFVMPVEAHDEAHDVEWTETEVGVLRALLNGAKSVPTLVTELGYATLSGNLEKGLAHLETLGFIALTLPDAPRSKQQKRQLTRVGRAALQRRGRKWKG